jgi:hypothetical protein
MLQANLQEILQAILQAMPVNTLRTSRLTQAPPA